MDEFIENFDWVVEGHVHLKIEVFNKKTFTDLLENFALGTILKSITETIYTGTFGKELAYVKEKTVKKFLKENDAENTFPAVWLFTLKLWKYI